MIPTTLGTTVNLAVCVKQLNNNDTNNSRDYCKFGCVCETIKMKPIPPTHCGKVRIIFIRIFNSIHHVSGFTTMRKDTNTLFG